MALDLFDWFKLTKKKPVVKDNKKRLKPKDQPDLFRVDSDDISEVRPKTEVIQSIRRTERKGIVRKL